MWSVSFICQFIPEAIKKWTTEGHGELAWDLFFVLARSLRAYGTGS